MTVRVLIADDHQVVRDGLSALLNQPPRFTVVGTASDGRDAVSMARALRPDVIIMDVAMPALNGVDATRQIVAAIPDARVIALSMHADSNYVSGMLQAGALAYVRKESAFEEIAAAIEAVMRDTVYLGEGVADVVVGQLKRLASQQPAGAADLLTGREREVLQLLAEGRKTSEIAATLHVSAKTIETHRRQIMSKLNLDSVAALTKYAIRTGLVSADR